MVVWRVLNSRGPVFSVSENLSPICSNVAVASCGLHQAADVIDADADADVHSDGAIDDAVGMNQQLVHTVPVVDPTVLLWPSCSVFTQLHATGTRRKPSEVRRFKGVLYILDNGRDAGIVPRNVSMLSRKPGACNRLISNCAYTT